MGSRYKSTLLIVTLMLTSGCTGFSNEENIVDNDDID